MERILKIFVSIFTAFLVSLTTYALTYPPSSPVGETPGGLFKDNFDKIFGAINFSGEKIGIGTTSPEKKVHIVSNIDTNDGNQGQLLVENTSTVGNSAIQIRSNGNVLSGLQFSKGNYSTSINGGVIGYDHLNEQLDFWTKDGSASPIQRLTIKKAGNVGIGTISPEKKVHIVSNIATNDGNQGQLLVENSSSVGNVGIQLRSNGNVLSGLQFSKGNYATSTNGGVITYDHLNQQLDLWTKDGSVNPLQRLTIKKAGNVGIGTINPNEKLEVAGKIKSSGIVSNGVIESTSGGIKFPNGTVQTTAATAGGSASSATFYQCPSGTNGWNPGGSWASYGCTGQISTASTCTNYEYPNTQVRNCTYLGKIMISP